MLKQIPAVAGIFIRKRNAGERKLTGRREDAARQFARAVQAENDPALQAYRRGEMLVFLYPSNRQKLLQARSHFAEAVRLQPRLGAAQARLNQLERALGPL